MDKQRLVIVMLVSLAVVSGWAYIRYLLQQQHPEWFEPPAQQQQVATQTPPPPGTAPSTPVDAGPATQQAAAPASAPAAGIRVVGGEGRPAQLGNPAFDPKGTFDYPVALSLDPRGASVASVTLNRFRRHVGNDEPYVFQTPYEDVPAEQSRALATRYVILNDKQYDLASVNWVRQGSAPATQPGAGETSATYSVELRDPSGQAVLAIDKQYQLLPRTHESGGYEVVVLYRLRNLASEPARVTLGFNGPNMPAPENYRDLPEVVVGHNDDRQVALEHHPASTYTPEKEAQSLKHSRYPLLWAGVLNAYFDAIVGPSARDGTSPLADVVASAPRKRTEDGREFTVLTMRTSELTVPPGQQVAVPMNVYFGPRQRAVLNMAYYDLFPREYDQTLVLVSGMCAYCTFQWLISALVHLLTGFHFALRDWGLAIVLLVLLVRLALHPITKRSQIAMSKMSKMGPEIDRLKKKYGDNKEELSKAMWQLQREQGIGPYLGCLPMFLQMPIWIALWSALQSTFELRHASFLWGYTWIDDLAQPDRLISFEPFKLWFLYFDAVNLLPIILGAVFYVQMKMQPKPPTMTPEQEQQQKMMQWMSLLFPLLLYNGPSGLNLYIATSTAIGIWESKRVRDHIKAQEEAEKRGVVVSDERHDDDRGKGRGPAAHPRGAKKPEAPKGRLAGWLANLQAKAEAFQREVEKKRRENR